METSADGHRLGTLITERLTQKRRESQSKLIKDIANISGKLGKVDKGS